MTVITYRAQNNTHSASTQVWRCEDCRCFHLLAGQTLLTFTPQEFATFTEEVAECYCVQMPVSKDLETGMALCENAYGADSGQPAAGE